MRLRHPTLQGVDSCGLAEAIHKCFSDTYHEFLMFLHALVHPFWYVCRALLLQQQQAAGLPERVIISAGRSRQRDHISGLLRDSTLALLTSWGSPFAFVTSSDNSPSAGNNNGNSNNISSAASTASSGNNGGSNGNGSNSKLEAAGTTVTEWLLGEGMQAVLGGFMRQPGSDRKGTGRNANASITSSITADLETEGKLDKRCQGAFAAVKEFEDNHCLSVQAMGAAYTAARPGLAAALLGLQSKLGVRDDVVHDAVLLMDRAMSASFKVRGCRGRGIAWLIGLTVQNVCVAE